MFLSSRQPNSRQLVTTYLPSNPNHNHRMRLPLLFAVPVDDTLDRVSVYQTTLLREGPDRWGDTPSVYLIAPYRIYHGHDDSEWPDRAFVRERGPAAAADAARLSNHDVMLVADYPAVAAAEESWHPAPPQPHSISRHVLYRGPWRTGNATVFSMYCATAIPVLQFNGHGYRRPWPMSQFNRLPLVPASIPLVRAWHGRWDPAVWRLDIDAEEAAAGGVAAGAHHHRDRFNSVDSDSDDALPALFSLIAATTAAGPTTAPPVAAPAPHVVSHSAVASTATLPSFVSEALVADAVRRGLACPITMEPITPEKAAVTPCYHVFDADALSAWVAQQPEDAATCPTCKARIG
jgi:hypothetical protein